ncbi:hypothetical protein [Tardiphaga sp.]|uniref:hypothetical protein n=1 Tax=Tardiphaga sp. TaxID=1926292 RepID=UPI00352B6AA3
MFAHLLHFVAFLHERLGGVSLPKVDQRFLDAYLHHAGDNGRRSSIQLVNYVRLAIDMHHLAPWLSGGGIAVLPWHGRSAFEIVRYPRKPRTENTTPRIPEPVIGSMLSWAIRYLDIYSADILAARNELTALEVRCAAMMMADGKRASSATYEERLKLWLDQRHAAGRGVPVWEKLPHMADRAGIGVDGNGGQINHVLVGLHVGNSRSGRISSTPRLASVISDAIARSGVEIGGMDTPISIDPDTDHPWRPRFDARSLVREEQMLQGACYLICAYLTGMRDSEVQAMLPGCVDIERSADGLIERYRVRSTVYKHRGAQGAAADWVTIEPVARAVRVMEALSAPAREARGLGSLWVTLRPSIYTADHLGSRAKHILNLFRDGLCERGEQGLGAHDGEAPWRFDTRQLRRTIAWYIANRPFGVIAGKIQYKHASVAMFEGYAGSPEGDFRDAIDRELAIGQLDDIVAHFETYVAGGQFGGNGATKMAKVFDDAHAELQELSPNVMDRARLRKMLAHLGRTLHVGFLNDCLFDPTTALCLGGTERQREEPILSRCIPDRCPNACLDERHRAPWEQSIAEGERLLRDGRLSANQREAIIRDNERKRRLIAPLSKGRKP